MVFAIEGSSSSSGAKKQKKEERKASTAWHENKKRPPTPLKKCSTAEKTTSRTEVDILDRSRPTPSQTSQSHQLDPAEEPHTASTGMPLRQKTLRGLRNESMIIMGSSLIRGISKHFGRGEVYVAYRPGATVYLFHRPTERAR